jgi:hypothetical protein
MGAIRDIDWFKGVMKVVKAKKPELVREYGLLANVRDGQDLMFACLDRDFPITAEDVAVQKPGREIPGSKDSNWAKIPMIETADRLKGLA